MPADLSSKAGRASRFPSTEREGGSERATLLPSLRADGSPGLPKSVSRYAPKGTLRPAKPFDARRQNSDWQRLSVVSIGQRQ
jgi:hypothetical protein